MNWQYTPYILPSLITAVVSMLIMVYIWYQREARGAIPTLLLLVATTWWSVNYILELGSQGLAIKLFWAKLQYLGIVAIPVIWIVFVRQFMAKSFALKGYMLLSLIPILTVLFVWTNERHNLIWQITRIGSNDPYVTLAVTYGPWFWIHTAYSYLVFLAGTAFIIIFMIQSTSNLYRRQITALLIAAITPFVTSVMFVIGYNPIPYLDLTPFSFTITGLALTWAVLHFRLLDLVPIAYNTVIDSMADGVIVTDKQRRIVHLNPSAERWVATYIQQPLMGQPLPAIFGRNLNWTNLYGINTQVTLEKDTAIHIFNLRIIPLHNRSHRSIGHLLVFHDITQQTHDAKQIRQYQDDLEVLVDEQTAELTNTIYQLHSEMAERSRAEAHLQHLLRASPAIIYSGALQGDYALTFISDNVQEILGHNSSQFTEDSQFWLNQIHPEDRHIITAALAHLSYNSSHLCEYRFKGKDGQYRWIQDEMRVVKRNRDSLEIVGYWIDISELHEAHRRLQQQQRLAAVGQLSAGIAHDFNNILTSIIGFAELMIRQPDRPESDQLKLKQIVDQGQKAAHLVTQILDFSRKSTARRECLDLTEFLYETIDLLKRTVLGDIRFVIEVESKPTLVEADVIQLQQALTNLALNARDAMPDGGVLRFQLTHFNLATSETPPSLDMPPGTWAHLTVQDTGQGIPEAVLPFIFEPFFTTKDIGQGSGLGLSQVYGIIKQHQGFMQVESEAGCGTTFSLYIPLQESL